MRYYYLCNKKVNTEGVTELKYDKYSAQSFVNFERDLRMVAGTEYGMLFGLIVDDIKPPDDAPVVASVEFMFEDELATIDQDIKWRVMIQYFMYKYQQTFLYP